MSKKFIHKSEWPMLVGLIFIVIMWLALFFHPIVIAFWMHSPIWLALYALIIPEFVCAFILTGLIIKLLE